MKQSRSSGILLHPTSLPGNYGIGSLGQQALHFIDFLHLAGQKLWQVLPMGHTGYGDSPYQCFSIFAGNPILIDLDSLKDDGLLDDLDLLNDETFDNGKVDYGKVIIFKNKVLLQAFAKFKQSYLLHDAYTLFINKNQHWLDDYATFIAIKEHFGGKPWWEWPEAYRFRQPETIERFTKKHAQSVSFQKFVQYLFHGQWHRVKRYANEKGISVVGDLPLYVAHDSADVWSNHLVFQFDENREPKHVAGVPPDYFSATGQLWGNPLYDWDYMQAHSFEWWAKRIEASIEQYDIIRIDHFRGFEAYWAVPYGDKTAENGKWIKAPGKELFEAIAAKLGKLPIIAEDLGVITDAVEALRDDFEFPGMKILQFAFSDDPDNCYLPHNYRRNFVVYTGTHDNDTLKGWYDNLEPEVCQQVREYIDSKTGNINQKLIRLAWSSVADVAIIPLQDLMELGSEARMNIPGTPSGNWHWRCQQHQLTHDKAAWLKHITKIYHR
ncbi:MAG TPA: 4-alpha-glucanotransferase [Bacteroidales bacterium]|nr:4-alpha-glucanotransferase [Bacteroidales bacterium]